MQRLMNGAVDITFHTCRAKERFIRINSWAVEGCADQVRQDNELIKRPRTAIFSPSRNMTAQNAYHALTAAGIGPEGVACMHCLMNGAVEITFQTRRAEERFIRKKSP